MKPNCIPDSDLSRFEDDGNPNEDIVCSGPSFSGYDEMAAYAQSKGLRLSPGGVMASAPSDQYTIDTSLVRRTVTWLGETWTAQSSRAVLDAINQVAGWLGQTV